ncbi:unnamed protein product [Acanthoscelides obtectus]|uniref:Uncharacterized protein n=1 Tax=Acanthoscelides obtectus TaxID=200917 RepID=A0A9P0K0Q3_ACAOB|nr:unnamed protein product [Acanthoscelides obtectus]CAK1669944.1 hypothetical protein AOBTE_LOCUS27314 [Acanthoscelides obtectus]
MDTPITISSADSTTKKLECDESVYSIESSSFERVPVSWGKRKPIIDTPFSTGAKVRRWMGDIEASRRHFDGDESELDNLSHSPSYVDTPSTEKSENRSLILVRCDFNKTLPQSPQSTYLQYLKNKTLSKTPSPIVDRKRNVGKFADTAMKRSVLLKQSPDKSNFCGYSSPVDRKFSVDADSYPKTMKQLGDSTIGDDPDVTEVPMSPESRKKELCTYLQLMDPADKKEILILQNRRSTRVRNLAVMQEKKLLDKQIMSSNLNLAAAQQKKHMLSSEVEVSVIPGNKEIEKQIVNYNKVNLVFVQDKKHLEKQAISSRVNHATVVQEKNQLKRQAINSKMNVFTLQGKKQPVSSNNLAAVQDKKHSGKQVVKSMETAEPNGSSRRKEIRIVREFSLSEEIRRKSELTTLQLRSTNEHSQKLVVSLGNSKLTKEGTGSHILTPLTSEHMKSQEKFEVIKRRPEDNCRMLDRKPQEKCETLKSFKELNIDLNKSIEKAPPEEEERNIFCFPFPPKEMTEEMEDFDVVMADRAPKFKKACRRRGYILQCPPFRKSKNKENLKEKSKQTKQKTSTSKQENNNKRDFNADPINSIEPKQQQITPKPRLRPNILRKSPKKNSDRVNNLRSNKDLSNIPFKKLTSNEKQLKAWKIMKKREMREHIKKTDSNDDKNLAVEEPFKMPLPKVEIVTVKEETDMNVYHENLMDDMIDFNNLSEEHKRCLIESRIFSADPCRLLGPDKSMPAALNCSIDVISPFSGFTKTDAQDAEKISEVCQSTALKEQRKSVDTQKAPPEEPQKGEKRDLIPFTKPAGTKSLHKSLQLSKRKNDSGSIEQNGPQEWDSDRGSVKTKATKKQSHSIYIDKENGSILKAFYVDYNLVICQERCVSFWMQTSLGHVLGSQDMWIPRGAAQRITLKQHQCIEKESMEMVLSTEATVAYIELWTKEHQSEMRQRPVADVFATVYFWKQRQKGIEKKVLQLENINGFADDVQYSVMKCVPKIVVSWHCASDDNMPKRTLIHCYDMAPDYQTVSNIYDIEPVQHYVSSLHNVEDCENLIMGCGENKITLWNIEHRSKIATIELSEIKTPLSTLWVKCDRGFLFALQQCLDRELRLIAINGLNNSWKKLASYYPPSGFDRLRGVCIENGMLLSFYDSGVLCWNAETGEPVEEIPLETELIPAGKYVIFLEDTRVIVKHVMTHLMSISADDY